MAKTSTLGKIQAGAKLKEKSEPSVTNPVALLF